ncbi:MAG: hypothetical protein AAGC60_09090 [Acidobacteriota bacterium]
MPSEAHAKTEVSGRVVLSIIGVMGAFKTVAREILGANGLGEAQPESWYPLDRFLGCFDTVAQRIGPNTVTAIGRHISATGPAPSEVHNLEEAFNVLDEAYRREHRGGDVGHYAYIATGERSCTIVSTTPYPPNFDEGVIQALVERFEPDSLVDVRIDHQAESRRDGGSSCTFLVNW